SRVPEGYRRAAASRGTAGSRLHRQENTRRRLSQNGAASRRSRLRRHALRLHRPPADHRDVESQKVQPQEDLPGLRHDFSRRDAQMMIMLSRVALRGSTAGIVGVMLAASNVTAHHSFAPHFDRSRSVDISGTVKAYEARN